MFKHNSNLGPNLKKRYACTQCGYWEEFSAKYCERCFHTFTHEDKWKMRNAYRKNRNENWHHSVYLAVFFLFIIGCLIF